MAAVFAFGKRGANNSAPVSNYLISKLIFYSTNLQVIERAA